MEHRHGLQRPGQRKVERLSQEQQTGTVLSVLAECTGG